MLYRRIPIEVDAIILGHEMTIAGKTGAVGDYFLTHPNGSVGFMPAKVFEANFEPVAAIQVDPAVLPEDDAVVKQEVFERSSKMICIGCGELVSKDMFDRKTGICADCLKANVTCQSCGSSIHQYDVIGIGCRRCVKLAQ